MDIKVRNASQARDVAFSYLRTQTDQNVPDRGLKWQERPLYSSGPEDLAITSKLFTADDWVAEAYQGVAPISATVFQVTIFNSRLRWYWKGNIKADGSLIEVSPLKSLSEDESLKMTEELSRRIDIPPTGPGGYGH